jgi:hypothetical protein
MQLVKLPKLGRCRNAAACLRPRNAKRFFGNDENTDRVETLVRLSSGNEAALLYRYDNFPATSLMNLIRKTRCSEFP